MCDNQITNKVAKNKLINSLKKVDVIIWIISIFLLNEAQFKNDKNHFIKSINAELEPNESYVIDIPELAKIITLNMNNGNQLTTEQQKNRIYDYIFLCFFTCYRLI